MTAGDLAASGGSSIRGRCAWTSATPEASDTGFPLGSTCTRRLIWMPGLPIGSGRPHTRATRLTMPARESCARRSRRPRNARSRTSRRCRAMSMSSTDGRLVARSRRTCQGGTCPPTAASPSAMLATIAHDAIRSFNLPRDRVRECPADDCRLIFLDTSRPGSRRWCSMRRCGNRAKARTHYARHQL
jgi:predicted RNA-binding Zn ribbon-like protein